MDGATMICLGKKNQPKIGMEFMRENYIRLKTGQMKQVMYSPIIGQKTAVYKVKNGLKNKNFIGTKN